MSKQEKLFNAILAKNNIARELRDYEPEGVISTSKIANCLIDIEEYLGTLNQPSVRDIINDETLSV